MTNKIIEAWNAQADHMNQWDALSEDEKLAWAYRAGLEDAAKAAEAQQDLAEQEKADKRFKAAMKDLEAGNASERNAVDRGDHWMCVSTCNAVLRNAAKAIRAMKDQP